MTFYPDRHHPCYFLEDALRELGAEAQVIRNADTLNCWGLTVNEKRMIWLVDNRWPHERVTEDPAARELMQRGVLVCHAQKPDAARVGGYWLPLAATPGYQPLTAPKRFDVAFVGYIRDDNRAAVLSDVASRFSLSLAKGVFGLNAVRTYCEARVGLNVPTRYGDPNAYDSANMRCFEVLATGIPLVTAREDYLLELGIIAGQTAALYENAGHVLEAVEYALDNADRLGAAGRQLVAERHTYQQRAQTVLGWLNA